MDNKQEDKQALRKEIAARKLQYAAEDMLEWSEIIRKKLENLMCFERAHNILLYHSLPGEVQTHSMLSNWQGSKQCFLPQVADGRLVVRRYEGEESLQKGQMNILEPMGAICTNLSAIDLVVAPGVAFDKYGHRLGRGKGYYDRLLSLIPGPTVGICFHFQLVDHVPVEEHDVKVEAVVTESVFHIDGMSCYRL